MEAKLHSAHKCSSPPHAHCCRVSQGSGFCCPSTHATIPKPNDPHVLPLLCQYCNALRQLHSTLPMLRSIA